MGWKSGKALNNYAPGKKIGGDVFRDDYNKLPKASNRIQRQFQQYHQLRKLLYIAL